MFVYLSKRVSSLSLSSNGTPGCFHLTQLFIKTSIGVLSSSITVELPAFTSMTIFLYFCLRSGGNEESEMCELQTAREWSDDDDDEGPDRDPDDEEGLASSPSIWGTPRQNSFELTFSYIAIAEAEAVGAARHLRDRRRGGSRGSRTSLIRTDTLETLLDSPDVDWDPQGFLGREEEEEQAERRERDARTASPAARREPHRRTDTITIQPSPQSLEPDTQSRDAGTHREERASVQSIQPPSPPPSPQHHSPSHTLRGEKTVAFHSQG